jgi:hypothetical protein
MSDPPSAQPQWAKTFRKRFRLPYHSFLDLVQMVDNERAVLGGMFYDGELMALTRTEK